MPVNAPGMELTRWTPLTYVAPGLFVDDGEFWADFDLEEWSRTTYEWTQDPWNGFLDVAKRPRETVADGTGDCEDYALVAASWAAAQGRNGIGLAFCWETPYPWPRHAIAFDAERVYSSGSITESSVDDWVAQSRYVFSVRRRVRS
ncbi:MAG: hypothetical protein ABEH66_04130 [Halobacteriales archaeon]